MHKFKISLYNIPTLNNRYNIVKKCMNMYLRVITLLIFSVLFSVESFSQPFHYPKDNPIELGKVKWLRDYDEAIRQSKEKDLPIFILFQEVPGCSNCTQFGNIILSHPLIVEAIESCFIPLCIFNNKGGKDKLILEKFNEPTWNNPVIRIINSNEKDIVKRQADFRNMSKTITTIIEAIHTSGKKVEPYIEILHEEIAAKETNHSDEAYFGMHCFWTGEREIAGLIGVINTEAGYMQGKEVVKVTYDNHKTSLDDLTSQAKSFGCADQVFASVQPNSKVHVLPTSTYRKDKEDKYYLRKSSYKYIPMTDMQKTKVNRAIAKGLNPSVYLSARQLGILINNKSTKNHVDSKIEDVWYE